MSTTAEPKPSVVDRLNLKWAARLLNSSIGRKAVMAATGLMLCGFLVAHLAGNLKLFNGRTAFDDYAHWLHDQEFLPLAELGLFVLFVLHIYLAVATTIENSRARRQAYALKESKRRDGVLYTWNWMFISGSVVLGFLILHIIDMKFAWRPDLTYLDEREAFRNTILVLSSPLSRGVYMVGTIFLGFHLAHGFSSAFQSLGLSHPKYTPLIKVIGILFAIVIAAGFFSLPLAVPSMPGIVEQATAPPTIE
ncbi:MAG: succinate dehydrogenase cytochrome b subunit [Planctomycetaceae bacterium]|nr:succinate dehydrogenase cytochrome b subunit [Planctomycetaceae bacterium]